MVSEREGSKAKVKSEHMKEKVWSEDTRTMNEDTR